LKSSVVADFGITPSVKAKFSTVDGLKHLEGVDAALKHMNGLAKAVSLASAPKVNPELLEKANAFGKFIH